MGGSSPLTRGKRLLRVIPVQGRRLIPAHAGKTACARGWARGSRAHPRSRGENRRTEGPGRCGSGSSPLTRGKPALAAATPSWKRLIPAHAGKTWPAARRPTARAAHPRSRGENAELMDRYTVQRGSSPLTRGKRQLRHREISVPGLIPAHAGKTLIPPLGFLGFWAHPRSRGENAEGWEPGGAISGSSPLTRGKLRDKSRRPCNDRLIPAHAGKTAASTSPRGMRPAHPRSRGENSLARLEIQSKEGSSPLTRGKRERWKSLE